MTHVVAENKMLPAVDACTSRLTSYTSAAHLTPPYADCVQVRAMQEGAYLICNLSIPLEKQHSQKQGDKHQEAKESDVILPPLGLFTVPVSIAQASNKMLQGLMLDLEHMLQGLSYISSLLAESQSI